MGAMGEPRDSFDVAVAKLPAVQAAQIATEVSRTPEMAFRIKQLLATRDPEKEIHLDQWKAIAEAREPGSFPESAGAWPAMTRFVREREHAGMAGLGTAKGEAAGGATEKALTAVGTAAAGAGIYGALFSAALDFAKPALVKNVQLAVDKKSKDKSPPAKQAEVKAVVQEMEVEHQASMVKAMPSVAPAPAKAGFDLGAAAPLAAAAVVALVLLGKK
jgi:hypothetical protein